MMDAGKETMVTIKLGNMRTGTYGDFKLVYLGVRIMLLFADRVDEGMLAL